MNKGPGVNGQPTFYREYRWDQPIGLARDGHLIMGPYKNSEGDLWTCEDRDVCNGAFVGKQYVYVGSDSFPYVLGCYGPGPKPEYKPSCTNNGCGSKSAEATGALSASLAGLSAAALVFTLC